MTVSVLLLATVLGAEPGNAQVASDAMPKVDFHLTARPWHPLPSSRDASLDAIEGVCRFTVRHQDARGAVIDPFLDREHQYSTPYFAFAVGTLLQAGRAPDLLQPGIRAMDHATGCFARGRAGIPDQHGEFFIPSLAGALELYDGHVPAGTLARWRERLRTPLEQVVRGLTNNWQTYAMRGEWLRARLGLVGREQARAFIEDAWLRTGQRERIVGDRWNLYQDRQTDPESHAVEAVGRGNLLGLIEQGYDGPSGDEIRRAVERGTATTLLLQDPSGQCPPNGRTDDHVFNDVLYQLGFEIMAGRAQREGDTRRAGQYRRAALLSFRSIARWRRGDGAWDGSYFVTKNRFDPAERVGYQDASNYGNYNGAVMLHLAEAHLTRATEIRQQPAPAEIGGYAFATDPRFASAVANAGGMQMFVALRGDTEKVKERYWTALGVLRFGRADWDSRLGPSDGEREAATGRGVSFAPTWVEDGRWVRLADVPDRYRGHFGVQFVHPLLVRCAIDYRPIRDEGPTFRHEFVLTPDGVLATLRATDATEFGVVWPLLENDGAPLEARVAGRVATTAYSPASDQQCFLGLDAGARADGQDELIRSTYGWLRPLRVVARGGVNHTYVYPRGAARGDEPADPPAEQVLASFRLGDAGYDSVLGTVHGTLYVGRTSAGGEGQQLDCDGDGQPDAVFDAPCRFILQLRRGRIVAVEVDRPLGGAIHGRRLDFRAFEPVSTIGNGVHLD